MQPWLCSWQDSLMSLSSILKSVSCYFCHSLKPITMTLFRLKYISFLFFLFGASQENKSIFIVFFSPYYESEQKQRELLRAAEETFHMQSFERERELLTRYLDVNRTEVHISSEPLAPAAQMFEAAVMADEVRAAASFKWQRLGAQCWNALFFCHDKWHFAKHCCPII